MRPDLTPLLNAQSVAIVGISQPDRFGGRLYTNLARFGYPGVIYGVNPRYTTLYDQPCYPSLSALPSRPDLAILAVPNERLLSAMEAAAGLGIRAVFIPGSAHSADGQLQAQLTALAQHHNLAVCGPNCMGFHAFTHKLVVSGYPVVPGTQAGYITFITHSGSLFDAVSQNRRGLHFNYLISSGNEIATTVADYMHFALGDPATRVIGLFIETVRDPRTFVAALRAAAERDVPIVALKVGRTEQGAQLALAHSGALAGKDAAYDALFAHYGVQRVRALDEMLDTLELFAAGLRPPTRFIASIHDSGGERGLLMDLAQAEGVTFAPIGAETVERLAAVLDPGLAPINPVDAWGTGNDYQRIFHDCILALDTDPLTGLTVFAVDLYPSDDDWLTYPEVALSLQPKLTKPLIFLSNLSASVGERHSQRLRDAGIPVLMGTETGVRAIKHLLDYAEFQRERKGWSVERGVSEHSPGAEHFRRLLQSTVDPPDEFISGEILSAYSIPIAARQLATTLAEALHAAVSLGYPVALKTAESHAHKSNVGGVRLNLRDAAALEAAYREMVTRLGPRVLVQRMAGAGVELLLGLVNDAQFGVMLMIGLGGVFVEALKESRLVMLPARRETIERALLGLRGATVLKGFRGQPPVNVQAVVEVALRLAALAADLGDEIAALDINPLIASADGALAVDALIVPMNRD